VQLILFVVVHVSKLFLPVRGTVGVFRVEKRSIGTGQRVVCCSRRQRKSRSTKQIRNDRFVIPAGLREIEDLGHRSRGSAEQAVGSDTQQALDRSDHVDGGVAVGDHGALLNIWSGNKGNAAMRINVIWAVLRVVFNDEDQRIAGVGTAGHLLYKQAECII